MLDETEASPALPQLASGDLTPAAGPHAPESPVLLVRRALRGRYPWAFGIGLVLAAGGSVCGALLPRPVFRCAGLIEIQPNVTKVLYDTDEKGVLPMFDSFVMTQVALLGSRRVVDMAMESPEWKAFGRGSTNEAIARFQKSLWVAPPSRGSLIEVNFTDEEPEAATAAVNQIVRAYMKIVEAHEQEGGRATVTALEAQQATLNARRSQLRSDILNATSNLGAEALEARYRSIVDQVLEYDRLINVLEIEISNARTLLAAGGRTDVTPATPQEIALTDPTMEALLLEKARLQKDMQRLLEVEQRGTADPRVIRAETALDDVEGRIETRARVRRSATPQGRSLESVLQEKEARLAEHRRMRDDSETEAKALARTRLSVANLEADLALADEQLELVKRRKEQIDVESGIQGRVRVLSQGSRPVAPETDRRVPLAILGGGGGIVLGFGLVALWGLRDARLRHIGDVARNSPRSRFLGILPDVEPQDAGPEAAEAAAMADFCVHHVRTMLQLGHTEPGRIVAFTSPSALSGKTTLELALGFSFGASGSRTLLVDCDFVGHGMTSAMRGLACWGARHALESGGPGASVGAGADGDAQSGFVARVVDARRREIPDSEVQELLARCRERADLDDETARRALRALEAAAGCSRESGPAQRSSFGLLDVLGGTPLEDCVVETCFPNVSVLPVGRADGQDFERLSPIALARVLDQCRERYDTVLVDTGPIVGSLEASFVAAKAHEVILVVRRGEVRTQVDEAIARLEQVGARIAGVVFNRASAADVVRSKYASGSRSTKESAA